MRIKILMALGLTLSLMNCSKELKMEVVESHPNGAKKREVYYYSQVANPRRVLLYGPDGKLKSDQFMKSGLPDSTTTIYHNNGSKYKEIMYIQDKKTKKEMKHGKETTWYENGQVKSESAYEKGFPTGTSVSYYEDGKKASEVVYKDGQKDGEEHHWFPDGKDKKVIPYVTGDINGVVKEWYENGNPKKEETYVNNILDGKYLTCHENGNKESEFTYKNGKIDGERKEWNESGKLTGEAKYEDGVLIEGTSY
jgi:antitoxin component YwqK of YwqJK toxin-antitoxin module